MIRTSRRLFLSLALLGLAGCSSAFLVDYKTLPPEVSRSWHVKDIIVTVPYDLTVNTENYMIPSEDIVWYGEQTGDTRQQVADIVKDGLKEGSASLKDSVPVIWDVELIKFHALTPKAFYRAPSGTGVESVRFKIKVLDARTHAVLVPEQIIAADGPAKVAADGGSRGYMERKRIVLKIAETTRGWLGIGYDNRRTFQRLGG
ncbi:DUF6778 family protein [Celeribacter halophilus]|uniref:DUF3313 domain-containing protein n=1 Tax=Celeribacter halophilus TaxID=576117 RepID=A0A1I3NP24_9RHOB|nr:DUF6778 family protein [Celeribacter halophilus]PZX14572.1 hypothetical protein LX82_00360 [Celeribacter halophilus]SFJ10526.1 hypothetical protein SAMN04488138_1029 [Celeribacter halophilus]